MKYNGNLLLLMNINLNSEIILSHKKNVMEVMSNVGKPWKYDGIS